MLFCAREQLLVREGKGNRRGRRGVFVHHGQYSEGLIDNLNVIIAVIVIIAEIKR